jgi:hypothetical protein
MDKSSPEAVYARADFIHWSKAAYWRIPEAVALLFGEDPEAVQRHLSKAKTYRGTRRRIQPFADEYDKICDLANRAVKAKQLHALSTPGAFLVWASRHKIEYPDELERQVLLHGHKMVDWQSSYENLKKRYADIEKEVTVLNQRRDALLRRVSELEEQLQQSGSKQLATRERDSVMKLIIGMAIRGYSYDPEVARNEAIGRICSDLALLGLSLDPDTVRKWLREAAELLPRQDSGAGQKQMR